MLSMLCHFHGLFFARQCWISRYADDCIGDLPIIDFEGSCQTLRHPVERIRLSLTPECRCAISVAQCLESLIRHQVFRSTSR
jgi:hypothetical protein